MPMYLLRETKARRIFTLLAGIAFLNLSFILAELSALDLIKKYKSLVQLVTNAGLEEEKEAGGEAGESDKAALDLIEENLTHHKILFRSAEQRNKALHNQSVHPGHADIFSPPPDQSAHRS